MVISVLLPAGPRFCMCTGSAVENRTDRQERESFVIQDLHLAGREVISHQFSTDRGPEHILVFEDGFSMSIGADRFSSDKAVLWLEMERGESGGRAGARYKAEAYLEGGISVEKIRGVGAVEISRTVIKKGESMVVRFDVTGGIFVTADKREIADPRGSELYRKALAAVSAVKPQPAAPGLPAERAVEKPGEKVAAKRAVEFRYPVSISQAGDVPLKVERTQAPDGTYVVTFIGRLYVWQKQDEKGGLLELQADSAVIFYSEEPSGAGEKGREGGRVEDFLAGGAVRAVYMSGDVLMTEGQRTVRADEIYYDFEEKKALAVNAVMRNFDAKRGIPIYVRAAKLRQLAENKFAGENITLTSSEFYLPQISVNASSIIITDTTPDDEQEGRVSNSSYDVEMRDVRFKMGEKTFFSWPFIRANLERPDIPLKSLHAGYDSDWGALVETRWYLLRLLGLEEPEGTESTFALDYYGKRGVGSGVEIAYAKENCFGRLLGYIIKDTGEDDLGRAGSRRNLEPPRELRGRFQWQHRHFLPYNWQLTAEVGYLSDENFLEGFYRSEFNVAKEQETLVHLKRIEDNWGLSILGKGRINDFVNQLEELPSLEYHLTGQSLFDDKFTLYSDSEVGRFRQRLASGSPTISEDFYSFMSERAELDMPVRVGNMKVVPFVAGTLAYDDGAGFHTNLDGQTVPSEQSVWTGEAGARVSTQYWKVYPNVKSRIWDLNQLRHIVRPYATVVGYAESDTVARQRDTLNAGISQRFQTRRGPVGNQRTVDWMRLDTEITWVNDSGDTSGGPDRFIWNKPFIPLLDTFSRTVPQQDRRSSDVFGPRRNYFGADYIWRLSDTTAILSDMNFDLQSGVVQQLNIGFSRLVWPNLSYYVGSRYLRRLDNGLGEKGSNAFTFAATYVLDPRYTVVFSQQFDFDYGANIRSDIALIRRYHRVYWGLTYSADESLKKQAVVFSIWPQGVPELGIGPRRYMRLGQSANY